MVTVKYDWRSGAYVDSNRKNFVKASVIREHAKTKLGIKKSRGRMSAEMVEAYWLDTFKEVVKYGL